MENEGAGSAAIEPLTVQGVGTATNPGGIVPLTAFLAWGVRTGVLGMMEDAANCRTAPHRSAGVALRYLLTLSPRGGLDVGNADVVAILSDFIDGGIMTPEQLTELIGLARPQSTKGAKRGLVHNPAD